MHDSTRDACVFGCASLDALAHYVWCVPLRRLLRATDSVDPGATVAQYFGVGPATHCGDPEPVVSQASVAYFSVCAYRRQHGVQPPARNVDRAAGARGALARETAPDRLWPSSTDVGLILARCSFKCGKHGQNLAPFRPILAEVCRTLDRTRVKIGQSFAEHRQNHRICATLVKLAKHRTNSATLVRK